MRKLLRAPSALALSLALALATSLGCDPSEPARDAGGGPRDAGVDAGGRMDSGPRIPPGRPDAQIEPRPDAAFAYPLDDLLTVQHIQMEGTHNSYHRRPSPMTIPDWDYDHAPLDVQLERLGVRNLELDLHWDEARGAFRVYHIATVDAVSTCDLFTECLEIIKTWSDAHPDHHPIVINFEAKDPVIREADAPFFAAQIEAEILSVWPEELLITPGMVRGDRASLAEALAEDGWPTLAESRGRLIFALDDNDVMRAAFVAGGEEAYRDRLIFVDVAPEDAFGGVAIINDPRATDRIDAALAAGLLVRLRADSDEELAAALAAGGHIISTDHPAPDPMFPFFLEIPGGTPSRCNPRTAPAECTSEAIEDRPVPAP